MDETERAVAAGRAFLERVKGHLSERTTIAMAELLSTSIRTAFLRQRLPEAVGPLEQIDTEIRTNLEKLAERLRSGEADVEGFLFHVLRLWLADIHRAIDFPDEVLSAKNAKAGKSRNPAMQETMEKIKGRWKEWQAGVTNYSGKAAFAQDMADEFGLKSTKNIEDRCRDWEKEGPDS